MKKLDRNLDVEFINKTFFSNYKIVSEINEGECFRWAYTAFRMYKNIELWNMHSHAFVFFKKNNKFYDAEYPNGVKDWKKLCATTGHGEFCMDCRQPAIRMNLHTFKYEWRLQLDRFNFTWGQVDYQVQKVIGKFNP